MVNDQDFRKNETFSRFELEREGSIAYADYQLSGSVLTIRYVFSPPELRGTGVASDLMTGIVDWAQAQKLEIVPICGYAVSWLKKHPRSD